MDRNQWNRNVLEHRIEQWREQRAQKMAARLQLNSTKPRTISSNVLGYVNYRQPMTVQPGFRQQHGEGPRFNHVDQRWNPNYNYAGYRGEHHSPHKQQYHHADHRNHGYGHGSYHQQHGQKKGGHFSSHKSLYNDRKSINKPNKRYSSSCSNISNTMEVGKQDVVSSIEQASVITCENAAPSSSLEINVNNQQVNSDCCENVTDVENVTTVGEDVGLNVEQEVEKRSGSDETIQESSLFESDRLQESTVYGTVETSLVSEPNENQLCEPQCHVDSCVPAAADISDISVLESVNASDEDPTLFVDANSTIAINIENSDITNNTVDADTISESPEEEVNDHETVEKLIVPESTDIDQKALSEDIDVKLVSEPVVTVPESSTIEDELIDVKLETVTVVEEISEIEQIASPGTNSDDAANETLDLELNLSFKPEVEIIVEDTDGAVDPLELNTQVAVDSASNEQSNNEGIGGRYAGTSYNENTAVFPVALLVAGDSDTEASIIRYDDVSSGSEDDHLSKDIEHVEKKLANISIANKEDAASDGKCFTPMKRERQQVLLDATNILPSSTIKFAVREVRKNDESEIIVTPVRRSARLSTLTPGSVRRSARLSPSTPKTICVQKLEELSPEVIQKMKFVQNPAINNPPEC